ncbi:MAG: tetratricopeptide repeat protein [Vampirovibrionales bacterium]|nr:tetratricopeptide repeat protein [Vampirovibrionales bacterium]
MSVLLFWPLGSTSATAAWAPPIVKELSLPLEHHTPVIFQQTLPNQGYAWGNVYYTMGLQLAARGQLLAAQPLLAQATTLIPDDSEGHLVYAAVLEGLGQLDAAKGQYQAAIALDTFQPDAHYKLGLLLDALGDTEGGKDELKEAIRLAPKEPMLYYDLGVMFAKQNNYTEAVGYAKQAVVLDPTFAEALNNYAYALAHLKRYEESLVAINQSLAIKPDSAASLDTRGFALYGLKRYPDALADYDTALAKNPNMGEIHLHRAQTLQALGRLNDALVAYQLYLALEPNAADKTTVEKVIQTLQSQLNLVGQVPSGDSEALKSPMSDALDSLPTTSLLRGDNLSNVLRPSHKATSIFPASGVLWRKPFVSPSTVLQQGPLGVPGNSLRIEPTTVTPMKVTP